MLAITGSSQVKMTDTATGMQDSEDSDEGMNEHISVHWFRHGLRLHDNPALLKSLKGAREFYPIFIWDGEVAGTKLVSYPRIKFLLECLTDLDKNLQKHGTRLYIFKGQPEEVIKDLISEWGITRLTFEIDPEPIWQPRDTGVKNLCKEKGIEVIEYNSHLLWEPERVAEANGGRPPHTYKLFCQVTELLGQPERPFADPDFSSVSLPLPNDFEDRLILPTLKELGHEPECPEQENPHNKWEGGETSALELLTVRLLIEKTAYKAGYILPNQYLPDLVGPPRSMSPHLRFGALSIRKFYWDLHDTYAEVCGKKWLSSVTAQLIWREYFYCMSFKNPDFDKMEGNPICLKIPWYKDDELLEKWTKGQTGYPWIDACMNQLRHEGWIHHVCRHAVSCFLTRGDLWLSWVDGLEVFYKYLLDGDWSVCAGNWMWVSSSAFENCLQCPQCFSPILYGMRMDPTGEYTRRYVPQLKHMPLKYLFQPWKAPLDVQQKAKCIIGQDYPKPIVDHKEASAKCKRMMEEVKNVVHDPDIWHCAPSNTEEVRKFCWLPEHMVDNQPCLGDFPCVGLEGL